MGTVYGYPARSSVVAGSSIAFHLSASNGVAGPRKLGVDRVYPSVGAATSASFTWNVGVQTVPATRAWEGYKWVSTGTFTVPVAWASGLYRVHEAGESLFDFVVRPAKPASTSSILFMINTHTWHAYWLQGGRNFYTNPRAERLSYDRPGAEYRQSGPFQQWLDSERIRVEFCASHDLHGVAALLDRYALLVVAEHDEYWSREMRDHVERFVRNGGNVAVFSGNTCYRQVRLEATRSHLMSCYKVPGADPVIDRTAASVAMASPPLCRPTPQTLGAGFTHGAGCWLDSGLVGTVDFTIRFPDHWVFAGVRGTTVAAGNVGYETDAVAFVDEPEGYPRVTGEDGVPATCTVLASADLRHWGRAGKPGMATTSLLVRNGMVFNAASVSWQNALAGDPATRRVTRNVIDRLRTRQRWASWEHIGHANDVTAMAANDNRLWCSTVDSRLWRRFPMGANAPWTPVGHANSVSSMAGAAAKLWCVTADNALWRRAHVEADIVWDRVGTGPAGGTCALAGTTFLLYAVDTAGKLWMAPARTPVVWEEVPLMAALEPSIRCMTTYEDILYAATTDGRLLRTMPDFVYESTGWVVAHHCNFAVGLAVVDTMLYVATTEDKLWWLDLRGVNAP